MRLLGQLVLAFALLAALVAARAPGGSPTSASKRSATFTVKQKQYKHPAVQNRGLKAMRRAMRKFGHADQMPAIPEEKKKQKEEEEKKGKGKLKKQGATANKAVAVQQKDGAAEPSTETATTDSQDTEYVCVVNVGTGKFRLNFDTGSSDL